MIIVRWITGLVVVAILFMFCVMGMRIDRDITRPLQSALRCYTPGEAVCYLQEAQSQLVKRGWQAEADQIIDLIYQLQGSTSINIDFSDVKTELRSMTEWKGENFPMPEMSHHRLIDKYRYGVLVVGIFWVSIVFLVLTFTWQSLLLSMVLLYSRFAKRSRPARRRRYSFSHYIR